MSMRVGAINLPNYRMYLAKGAGHTVIDDDSMLAEGSGDVIAVRDWFAAMLSGPRRGGMA